VLTTDSSLIKKNLVLLFFNHPLNVEELLNNVSEDVDTRQKYLKERSLHQVNEHFENVFNTVATT
jgi:hypothetical protein